jgi:hypothetical protein
MADLWVDNRHGEWAAGVLRRRYTRDQYSGRALDVSQYEANKMADASDVSNGSVAPTSKFMSEASLPVGTYRMGYLSQGGTYAPRKNGGYGTYLIRRSQGESAEAFAERARITRFPSHMPALIEAYVGGVAQVEGAGKWKVWEEGPILGSIKDTASIAYHMWNDVDGTGRNFLGALNTAKINLIVDDVFWSFTTKSSLDLPTTTTIIDPDRIVDWHDDEFGRPMWLLLAEDVMERPNMHEPSILVQYFTEYDLEGWTRYKVEEVELKKKITRKLTVVESGEWSHPFYTDPSKTRVRLPFTRVVLSDLLGRHVGFQMAQDHNALYNILSDARWNFRVVNFPRLRGKDVDDKLFDRVEAGLIAGGSMLQGDWDFISPDSANGMDAYSTYDKETQQFYVTNHQRMNSSTIERSATEVQFNQAEGRTAFLSVFAGAIDEIHNDQLFLTAQIEAPDKPELWLSSRVERSRDFKPVDIDALAQRQVLSFVSAVNSVDAETAAMMARDGLSKEVVERLRTQGTDQVVDEVL